MRLENLNIRIGPISQWIDPHFTYCSECGTTWRFVKTKSTDVVDGNPCRVNTKHGEEVYYPRGVFTVCQKCWDELPQEVIMLHYVQAFHDREDFDAIADGLWEEFQSETPTTEEV